MTRASLIQGLVAAGRDWLKVRDDLYYLDKTQAVLDEYGIAVDLLQLMEQTLEA